MRSAILPMLLVVGPAPAVAASGLLCEAVKSTTGEPFATAAVVFPKARSKAQDCIYPLDRLRYGDADVLLTKRGGPEQNDCHGCGARLSAFVLRRTPDGPKIVATFVDFIETGSSGNAGDIAAIQLDGHDAFVVAGGGTFQGYTSAALDVFVFRDGRLDAIKPSLPLEAENGGAVGDGQAITVDGAWHVDPVRRAMVTIDYRVIAGGKTRRSSATWTLDGNAFRLVNGKVPDDYRAASGN